MCSRAVISKLSGASPLENIRLCTKSLHCKATNGSRQGTVRKQSLKRHDLNLERPRKLGPLLMLWWL